VLKVEGARSLTSRTSRLEKACADKGVTHFAATALTALMKNDEDLAEKIDADKRDLAARKEEVAEVIRMGAGG